MLKKAVSVRLASDDQTDAMKVWSDTALICFSHLRWDFVFQRPQHIMSRLAKFAPVHFWEEPCTTDDAKQPLLDIRKCPQTGVTLIRPLLPLDFDATKTNEFLREMLDGYVENIGARHLIKWYYTPMMLPFSERIAASCTVYDCMDELANFRFAPPKLIEFEKRLFEIADVVFTGGYSLYEAKRRQHSNVHPFPSSVDRRHFEQARKRAEKWPAYKNIPAPRLGFYGVIDERMDLDLLADLADARPEWQLVMVGPLAKISEADLPRRANIH